MNLPAKTRLPPSNRRFHFHRPSIGKRMCTGFPNEPLGDCKLSRADSGAFIVFLLLLSSVCHLPPENCAGHRRCAEAFTAQDKTDTGDSFSEGALISTCLVLCVLYVAFLSLMNNPNAH